MTLFNQTFTSDKPIYYPSNWGSGKTAFDLHEEWKETVSYFILSNLFQCVLAGIWLFLIYVICNAVKQLWRLYKLDDNNRQKIENRRYINSTSIMSTSFLAVIIFSVTLVLLFIDDFTKYALLKGVFTWIILIATTKIYKKVKNTNSNARSKNIYEKIKKQEQ